MTVLHYVGDFVRALMMAVPLAVARGLFIALPVILIIWVLTLPRHATTPPDGPPRLGNNLKLWAVLALLIQVFIYSVM